MRLSQIEFAILLDSIGAFVWSSSTKLLLITFFPSLYIHRPYAL